MKPKKEEKMATIIKISKNQFRVREQSKFLRFDKTVKTKLEAENLNREIDNKVNLKKLKLQSNAVKTKVTLGIVTVTFKRTDSHGLYDTHYLRALKKNLVEKSQINFYNALIWSPDMVLKKQDSIL